MEPAVFILAIMGCHEGSAACEPLALMPTRYESAAACEAGSAEGLQRQISIDTDYPVVMVQCLRIDPAAAALREAVDLEQETPKPKSRAAPTQGPWAMERARG